MMEDCVLFIEDIGEYMYHIDRMMQNLHRRGRLGRIKAIVVGHFAGRSCYDLIASYAEPHSIPVIFGFPSAHSEPNIVLYMGRKVRVEVTSDKAVLNFL